MSITHDNTKTLWPHKAKCAWCEKEFITNSRAQFGAMRAGRNVYCSTECLNAQCRANGESRYMLGPCPTCGRMFKSRTRGKRFCSQKCYVTNPETQARLKGYNEKRRAAPKLCPQCGKSFQHHAKKYCSNMCRRKYFAERFDRWVANPEQIALPQNFDEFMARDVLPCLVEGCDWEGENLACHVNFAHGITADQFRELAGFNRKTGLVGAALHELMSERTRRMIATGVLEAPPRSLDGVDRSVTYSPRLEAKEHGMKARALLSGARSERAAKPCLYCGQDVVQPYWGRALYCSTICRSKYYQMKGRAEIRCDYCGQAFTGERAQVLRVRRNQKVCCSPLCRNRMNIVAALAARGIKQDEP